MSKSSFSEQGWRQNLEENGAHSHTHCNIWDLYKAPASNSDFAFMLLQFLSHPIITCCRKETFLSHNTVNRPTLAGNSAEKLLCGSWYGNPMIYSLKLHHLPATQHLSAPYEPLQAMRKQNEKPDIPSPHTDCKACDTLFTLLCLCRKAFISCSHLEDLLEGLNCKCRPHLT